jgi:polyhydroxyalkanoate synthesis regulator phasin
MTSRQPSGPQSLAEGNLTPEEAAEVMQALTAQARIVEIDEIEKRVTALEQAAATKGNNG